MYTSMEQNEQLLDCLRWTATRIGPDTLSFEFKAGCVRKTIKKCLPQCLIHTLKEPHSDTAYLSQLRCFSFDTSTNCVPEAEMLAAITAFQEWIFTQAPHIEALHLPYNDAHLTAFAGRLQHLKHVEMDADAFAQGVSKAARQLPCLETLYLHIYKFYQGATEVNMLGCQHLRHLVLKSRYRYICSVLHEPKCRLGINADVSGYRDPGREDWAALQQKLQDAKDFCVKGYSPHEDSQVPRQPGVRGQLKVVETLTLDWPVRQDMCYEPDMYMAAEDSEDMVKCCMPVNGPLQSLKVLIIRAEAAMWCRIPSGLPNLEELVLHAKGNAKVSFESQRSTFSAKLKSLYILSEYGLRTEDESKNVEDLRQLSLQVVTDLARRGLTTSCVSARGDSRRGPSCMYLRPIMARELTYKELHDKVNKLARQCRCSACFDCLRRAGCLTWC